MVKTLNIGLDDDVHEKADEIKQDLNLTWRQFIETSANALLAEYTIQDWPESITFDQSSADDGYQLQFRTDNDDQVSVNVSEEAMEELRTAIQQQYHSSLEADEEYASRLQEQVIARARGSDAKALRAALDAMEDRPPGIRHWLGSEQEIAMIRDALEQDTETAAQVPNSQDISVTVHEVSDGDGEAVWDTIDSVDQERGRIALGLGGVAHSCPTYTDYTELWEELGLDFREEEAAKIQASIPRHRITIEGHSITFDAQELFRGGVTKLRNVLPNIGVEPGTQLSMTKIGFGVDNPTETSAFCIEFESSVEDTVSGVIARGRVNELPKGTDELADESYGREGIQISVGGLLASTSASLPSLSKASLSSLSKETRQEILEFRSAAGGIFNLTHDEDEVIGFRETAYDSSIYVEEAAELLEDAGFDEVASHYRQASEELDGFNEINLRPQLEQDIFEKTKWTKLSNFIEKFESTSDRLEGEADEVRDLSDEVDIL